MPINESTRGHGVRRAGRLVLVGLLAGVFALAGCAEDSTENDGSDQQGIASEQDSPALPPGKYTWLLRREGTSNADCEVGTCPAPAWAGTFEVAKDGGITGTGKMGHPGVGVGKVDQYEWHACTGGGLQDAITPKQDATLSGTVPAEGKAMLRIEFGDVDWDERQDRDCNEDVYNTLAEMQAGLAPWLEDGESRTTKLPGQTGETFVQVNGAKFAFYW